MQGTRGVVLSDCGHTLTSLSARYKGDAATALLACYLPQDPD